MFCAPRRRRAVPCRANRGGIAEYLDVDPTLVRVVYVLLSILSAAFPGILVYILLAFLLPKDNARAPA